MKSLIILYRGIYLITVAVCIKNGKLSVRGCDWPKGIHRCRAGNIKNIVQVLPAACEGCPINRFSVTNNCQMCMAKKCMSACNFGAITFESGRAHIDPKKCKECGRCVEACPYNAIADLMRPCKRACPGRRHFL